MFRTKKKKSNTQKRRNVSESLDEDVSIKDVENVVKETKEEDEKTLPSDEEELAAIQARARQRQAKRSKARNSMQFTSTGKKASTKQSLNDAISDDNAGQRLSFMEKVDSMQDTDSSSPVEKVKIRANVIASSVLNGGDESPEMNRYSSAMLEALRKEQNTLLPTHEPSTIEEIQLDNNTKTNASSEDVEMQSPQPEDASTEEDFISMDASRPQSKRRKVTFGQDQVHELPQSSADEDMSEEDEEEQKWEEELIRRGGLQPKSRTPEDKKPGTRHEASYPTHKRVPSSSISFVLNALKKSLDAVSDGQDRLQRQEAKLQADSALLEKTLVEQKQELAASSEQFEYFQMMEDFVRGLSLCLRDKLQSIQRKEDQVETERVQVEREMQIQERGQYHLLQTELSAGKIDPIDIVGKSMPSDAPTSFNPTLNSSQFTRQPFHDTEQYDAFRLTDKEYATLENVVFKFREWQTKFPDVYKSCYGALATPNLFAVYVRADLVFWDPLSVSELQPQPWTLEVFDWFRLLRQDPLEDSNILNRIVQDVVVSRVENVVRQRFCVHAVMHVQSAAVLIEALGQYKASVQSIADVVLKQFQSAIDRSALLISSPTDDASIQALAKGLLEQYTAVMENLASFVLALPVGSIQFNGLNCLLQALHLLSAFLQRSFDRQKTHLIKQAVEAVLDLQSSPSLQQAIKSSPPYLQREYRDRIQVITQFK